MKPKRNQSSHHWLANPQLKDLAKLWMDFQTHPGDKKAANRFYQKLDEFLADWNPKIKGMTIEEALIKKIRQDALVLLNHGHLAGSHSLSLATRKKSQTGVERTLLQTMRSA